MSGELLVARSPTLNQLMDCQGIYFHNKIVINASSHPNRFYEDNKSDNI